MDPEAETVTTQEFPAPAQMPQFNMFDFPTINELFRGRAYCWVYGVVAMDYHRTSIVKAAQPTYPTCRCFQMMFLPHLNPCNFLKNTTSTW